MSEADCISQQWSALTFGQWGRAATQSVHAWNRQWQWELVWTRGSDVVQSSVPVVVWQCDTIIVVYYAANQHTYAPLWCLWCDAAGWMRRNVETTSLGDRCRHRHSSVNVADGAALNIDVVLCVGDNNIKNITFGSSDIERNNQKQVAVIATVLTD